jgi:hypothetical protein
MIQKIWTKLTMSLLVTSLRKGLKDSLTLPVAIIGGTLFIFHLGFLLKLISLHNIANITSFVGFPGR